VLLVPFALPIPNSIVEQEIGSRSSLVEIKQLPPFRMDVSLGRPKVVGKSHGFGRLRRWAFGTSR